MYILIQIFGYIYMTLVLLGIENRNGKVTIFGVKSLVGYYEKGC